MSEHTASNAGQLLVSAAIPVTEICMIAALGAIMVRKVGGRAVGWAGAGTA